MLARLSRMRLGLAHALLGLGICLMLAAPSIAGDDKKERDIYDHEAHKTAKAGTRIALVADTDPHGPRGNHEFVAAAVYLARTINAQYPDAYAAVYTRQKWPKDLNHADAIFVLMNHGGPAINPPAKEPTDRATGFTAGQYGGDGHEGEH